MNVTVENLAPCKKLVRVEIDVQTVDTTFETVTRDFQKHASLPGFRPGKAPRTIVENAFGTRIEEEVKRKLINESYRQALDQEKLQVVTQPDIEEIQFGRGKALQFAATIEVEPEFELPEYKGLPVKQEARVTTEADIEKALNVLRDQRAAYNDVARPVQEGDFVVVNYTGTCEGKPITELSPTARGLTEQKNFWVRVDNNSFIPGFAPQLIGASAGEKRTVNVDYPADFVAPQLSGKKGVYEVEVVQVKERILPELNDEFAKSFGAESLEKLRAGVQTDLQNELNYKRKRETRNQLVGALLERVKCELPESVVMAETRNVIYNLVRENQERGVTKETIDKQKDEIYSVANSSAKDRVKVSFILNRIARKEGVKVNQEEIAERLMVLAQQYNMKPEKLAKEIRERDGFAEIHEQILTSKVLDFLELNAKVEEVPASSTNA